MSFLGKKDRGGLGILDVETRLKAMKVQYVQRLLKNYESLNAVLAKLSQVLVRLAVKELYGNSVNINLYPHAEVPSA